MEQWFDPKTAEVLGGALGGSLGFAGVVIGCLYRLCVRKGWKELFYIVYAFIMAIYAGLFITGLIALLIKQPYHCFLIPGFIGTLLFSILFPVIRKSFIEGEMRKIQAKDL